MKIVIFQGYLDLLKNVVFFFVWWALHVNSRCWYGGLSRMKTYEFNCVSKWSCWQPCFPISKVATSLHFCSFRGSSAVVFVFVCLFGYDPAIFFKISISEWVLALSWFVVDFYFCGYIQLTLNIFDNFCLWIPHLAFRLHLRDWCYLLFMRTFFC